MASYTNTMICFQYPSSFSRCLFTLIVNIAHKEGKDVKYLQETARFSQRLLSDLFDEDIILVFIQFMSLLNTIALE